MTLKLTIECPALRPFTDIFFVLPPVIIKLDGMIETKSGCCTSIVTRTDTLEFSLHEIIK